MALIAPNVSRAPVTMVSRRCPLCATSRGTCLPTYFTSARVRYGDSEVRYDLVLVAEAHFVRTETRLTWALHRYAL